MHIWVNWETDYEKASLDPDISERVARGELFALGRNYLSGSVTIEAHPLVKLYLTVINNLDDPSGTIQPRVIISATQNTEIRIGGTIYYGSEGTEFGGFQIPGTDLDNESANDFFIWVFYYF